MKKVKLGLVFMLVFVILVGTSSLSFANTNNVITADEFYGAIKAEYEKNHIQFDVIEYDPSFVYTEELLQSKLADICREMSFVSNYSEELNAFVEYGTVEASYPEITPRAMFYDKTYNYKTTVNSPLKILGVLMGWAEIEVSATVTINGSNSEYVSINSVTSRQFGAALNFQSWSQNYIESNTKIFNGGKNMQAYVNGTLVISYRDPKIGGLYTYSSDHVVGFGSGLS